MGMERDGWLSLLGGEESICFSNVSVNSDTLWCEVSISFVYVPILAIDSRLSRMCFLVRLRIRKSDREREKTNLHQERLYLSLSFMAQARLCHLTLVMDGGYRNGRVDVHTRDFGWEGGR